jgi:hypothetical protein
MDQIVSEFSKKYDILQETDIEDVEKCDFSSANYKAIDGKKYVSIYTTKCKEEKEEEEEEEEEEKEEDKYTLVFGNIRILIEEIDEEEWYYIEKNILFSIDNVNKDNISMNMLETISKQHNFFSSNTTRDF